MCGIAGIFTKLDTPVAESLQRSLADALAHRGPDGEGFYNSAGLTLIHKRLSIIDVDGGAQPLASPDQKTQLILNGEIYNYKNLQKNAKDDDFSLKTESDCEPVLHLYQKYGLNFVQHMSGMYALALWDDNQKRLVLARDPFGIKPLYYAATEEGVIFASEPAALTKCGWVDAEMNYDLIPAFLSRQYVGGERTFWRGIHRLLPGEMLVIEQGEIKEIRNFAAPLNAVEEQTEAEALAKFDGLLHKSVKLHLQSDVPYGVFLSGGIDSSTMVTAMQNVLAEGGEPPARTYTIGFGSETVKDEREIAEKLAAEIGAKHTSILFEEADFWNYLPQFVTALDDPIADYASLPVLKLSEIAKQDVKVILSGEGGDEIFAGYGRYRSKWWHKLVGKKFRGSGTIAGAKHFIQKEFQGWEGEDFIKIPSLTELQQRQIWDISDWLPDNLLIKADRCLMFHGIEGRVPFLDLDLARFGFSLPNTLKVKEKHGKWLVKHWLEINQPLHPVWEKKSGFTVPIRAWLNNKQQEIVDYLASVEGVAPIIHVQNLQDSCAVPWDKKEAKLIFNLLIFAGWWQQHMAGQTPYAGLID
jgi:asparagine synthase (glutamine-hydrolysing)